MNTAVAVAEVKVPALAMNEAELMRVLQSSLYPGAATESIKLVLSYCKASGLDPMQKPVHIVPMWDSKSSSMRDVVMPGVNLYRTQAARSGALAGMSEPEYGPDITATLGGASITYPDWCRVTVKRVLANGIIAEFTSREYWIENYAIKGGKDKSQAPNAMWTKRPRGQIAKCAQAQALRMAFPEIASQPTADEMEGKQMIDMGTVEDVPSELGTKWVDRANGAGSTELLAAIWADGLKEIKTANDMGAYNLFKAAVEAKGKALKAQPGSEASSPESSEPSAPAIDDDFVRDMEREEQS